MGACLSCLKSNQTVQEDEDVSLLSDDKAKVVEDELMTELRNRQLNAILNSTNVHLIDISTFKSMSTYGSTIENADNGVDNDQEQDPEQDQEHDQEDNEAFQITPIPQATINEEMKLQYKDWISKLGESTVKKYMQLKVDPSLENQKYVVDLA